MASQVQNREAFTQPHQEPQAVRGNYPKILVAVDYLGATPEVFEEALHLAKANQSQLMIFYCVQGRLPGVNDLPIYAGMAGYAGIYSQEMVQLEEKLIQESTAELKAWLEKFTKQAKTEGIEASADYSYGEPGRQICSVANHWGANLIVIGRRGRSGLSELVLGSVSNYVVHHAPCDILVVQH